MSCDALKCISQQVQSGHLWQTYITSLKLVDFGLHHDGVVVNGREGDGVRVLPVFFL